MLSLNEVMRRDATIQNMRENSCYQHLTSAGIIVDSLRPYSEELPDPTVFNEAELLRFEQYASRADVILSLKEQPLHLINQANTGGKPIIVCLHRSDPENQGAALFELQKAILTGQVVACICCAESTRDAYFRAGIPAEKLHVVTNGVNLLRFKPDPIGRVRLRAELGIPQESPVVVFAARYDRMKNVPLFLRSAKLYLEQEPKAHITMCGSGMSFDNQDLYKHLTKIFKSTSALLERIHLLSIRRDIEVVYAAADIVTLTSSVGEAYPLSLVEGMMCGAVPVATDIGDSAAIVTNRGIVVSSNPTAIVSAWQQAYVRRGEFAATAAQDRSLFSREKMVAAYWLIIRRLHKQSQVRSPQGQPNNADLAPAVA